MRIGTIVSFLAILVVGNSGAVAANERPETLVDGATRELAKGDILQVEVLTNAAAFPPKSLDPLLPKQFFVAIGEDGLLSLGTKYGSVQAGGKSLRELESAIHEALASELGEVVARLKQNETSGQLPELQINVRANYVGRFDDRNSPELFHELQLTGHSPLNITPGDILQIESQVDGLKTRRSVVEPDGNLALGPQWGRVNVAGKSLLEAESTVRDHVKEHIENPEIQVTYAGHTADWSTGGQLQMNDPTAMLQRFENEFYQLKTILQQFQKLVPR
jgi:protein involved in polysaccharide export with SLBB domain